MTIRYRLLPAASLRASLATLALLACTIEDGRAADRGYGASVGTSGSEISGSRRMDLSIGRSTIIELPRDAKEVFVANPGVANAVVRSARKMFLIGIAYGGTSVIATDAEGRQIAAFEVNVGRDLNPLRQTLQRVIPGGRIDVRPAGGSILLTGTVGTAGDAQQAADIAKAFVGAEATPQVNASPASGGGGAPSATMAGQVINALTIAGRDQVMLKVSVVEMARSAVKQLGINIGGNWNIVETAAGAAGAAIAKANPATNLVGFASGAIGQAGPNGADISGQFGSRSYNVGGNLKALEQAGLSRVLAEPTLVAISGESASFLAGGELPIPINSCSAGSGGASVCLPTVLFKQYGVALNFTPIVLSPGRISLRVSTEVSEIDRDNIDPVTRTPGFRTRKQATTVELPSGGTMVTAGLISSQTNQTISGVPGLINLPILGALFRSRDFQRRDSELLIMVTPYLAKPQESAQVVRPDDGFQNPTDPQALLMGRLNRIYGTAGPGGARRVPGRFGFITD